MSRRRSGWSRLGACTSSATRFGVTTAPPPIHMAQEPLDQRQLREPSSKQQQQPPQQEDREILREHEQAPAPRPLQPTSTSSRAVVVGQEAAAGTSGGGAGDWLRLGLAPASPGARSQQQLDLFSVDRAGPLAQTRPLPPGAFSRPAVPGIPHAPVTLPAGPPWLPQWGPATAASPPMLPFAGRMFYTPGGAGASSGVDTIRVVLPPAAVVAVAGVWFALQAAPHQGREPFLPQIPRSYLRIKDVRVTVGLLIKYLVSKLGLQDESEVEVTCRGRPLLPFLSLQHVRDSIWCQGDAAVSPSSVTPPPDDVSAANHVMVLQYGRRP